MTTSSPTSLFKGIYTALVTPFYPDGSIDWKSYEALLDHQIHSGVHGVVPCGTTGEAPTLSSEEKKLLIEKAVQKCKGRIQVIAGTGANDTQKTIQDSKDAATLGVDGILVVTPYYNKPSQKGLEIHFKSVADESSVPVILYNVPGRTGVSISPTTVAHLAEHPKIVGIKEATGNLTLLTEIRNEVRKKQKKPFSYLSGDDPTFWPFLASGGDGVISVASNVVPRNMRALFDNWNEGRTGLGLSLFEKLYEFFKTIFIEPNPVPIKTILGWEKRLHPKVRMPLSEMTPENTKALKAMWDSLLPHLRQDRPREDLNG